MKKLFVFVMLLLSLFLIFPSKAQAATTYGELLDELAELQRQKREKEEQKELNEAEYSRVSNEIIETQRRINELNKQIVETTNEIARLEEEIEKKKEETDSILRFLQISNGEKTYLEYIFKATSFTDFIHRVSIVEQLSKYNDDLIKDMNEMIKKNEQLKKDLAEKVKSEEAERVSLEANLKKIGSRINELDDEGATLEDSIEDTQKQIDYYDNLGCNDRNTNLYQCLLDIKRKQESEEDLSALYEMLGATSFLRPIPKGIVTSGFGYRKDPLGFSTTSYHSGLDISDSSPAEGQPIYAIASGIVAHKTKWTCGGNVVIVYHSLNGVLYSSVYMHLLDITVEIGDIVTANDIVGHMGGYSTSTAHGGYDYCTTGAHIHLSICKGHVTTGNYRSYLIDPSTLINFPSGWFYSRTWTW